ncbi:MAG TPA: hypothetical protein VMT86_20640 [Bryobacteraceae bacterium]|nr:hypothetical protein [Bryobacteraceae bacterium]
MQNAGSYSAAIAPNTWVGDGQPAAGISAQQLERHGHRASYRAVVLHESDECSRRVQPGGGETIVLYGTGFGATEPAIPNGQLIPAPLELIEWPTASAHAMQGEITLSWYCRVTPAHSQEPSLR